MARWASSPPTTPSLLRDLDLITLYPDDRDLIVFRISTLACIDLRHAAEMVLFVLTHHTHIRAIGCVNFALFIDLTYI